MKNDTITITIRYNKDMMLGDVNVTYDDEYIESVSAEDVAKILEAVVADIREQLEDDAE